MMKKIIVLLAAVAMVAAFTVSASAAEWDFYGSARMKTFHEMLDEDAGDDNGTTWDLQGNARIGATVQSGDVGGGFEYGGTANLRKLYGTWNFGNKELLVGQTYSPVSSYFYANQVVGDDNDLLGYEYGPGQAYAGRQPMIQLKLMDGKIKLALVKPNSLTVGSFNDTYAIVGDTDIMLPKFEFAYKLSKEKGFLDVFFGTQYYNIEDVTYVDTAGTIISDDFSMFSAVIGVGGGMNAGKFYLKGGLHYALNGGQYGLAATGDNAAYWTLNAAGDDLEVEDTGTLAGLLVMGVNASDKVTVEWGGGYETNMTDLDTPEDTDDSMALYVNATINLADGVFVVPEVGYVDYMEDYAAVDQGTLTYFGAKWQINF